MENRIFGFIDYDGNITIFAKREPDVFDEDCSKNGYRFSISAENPSYHPVRFIDADKYVGDQKFNIAYDRVEKFLNMFMR